MKELVVPAAVALGPSDNLTDIPFRNAESDPHRVAFLRRGEGARWHEVTAREFASDVLAMAKGLVSAGVGPGDRVGLLSKTRYEWAVADMAIWSAGAVTVPIYETSAPDQVRWMLGDSGAVACLVETEEHARLLEKVRPELPDLASVWVFDAATPDRAAMTCLSSSGEDVPDDEIATRRSALTGDSLATLIYTSGTTGRPKGCMLTHRNLRAEADNAVQHVPEIFRHPESTILLFLPLAHVLARAVHIMCLAGRARIAHTADVKNLAEELGQVRPTFLLAVPRVFEKVYNGAEQKAEGAGKGKIFRAAAATAIAYSSALDSGGPGMVLRLKHRVFDKLVYSKLRAALGGRLEYAISGGAPLGERLGHFYRGVGINILEGYGLTETSAAAHVNTPSDTRIGTVGKPLPGVTVRVTDEGEVRFRGDIVFSGYFNNDEATKAAFDEEGFLRTGDLGELDDDGFLRITGRSKEILVTAGGKNVAPAFLEDQLRAHPLISQCLVVGDARPYVACLVTLDAEALPTWLENRKRRPAGAAELTEDPEIRASIQAAVDEVNDKVSRAESIRKFAILPVDFTEHGGQLTPSLKVKRSVVVEQFSAEIEQLYAG